MKEQILFIAVGILMGASLVLGVVNFVQYKTLATKMNDNSNAIQQLVNFINQQIKGQQGQVQK